MTDQAAGDRNRGEGVTGGGYHPDLDDPKLQRWIQEYEESLKDPSPNGEPYMSRAELEGVIDDLRNGRRPALLED